MHHSLTTIDERHTPKLRIRACAGILGALVMAWAMSLSAHHTVTDIVDTSSRVTLEGTLIRVHWKAPHVILQIETKERKGSTAIWSVETQSPQGLSRAGLTQQSFTIGQVLSATVCVAKDDIRWAVTHEIAQPRAAAAVSMGGC